MILFIRELKHNYYQKTFRGKPEETNQNCKRIWKKLHLCDKKYCGHATVFKQKYIWY